MRYRFAAFELDDERYELRRAARVIELQPKVMEVLLHLVRNADRACSKQELLEAVWCGVRVGEASLVRCIALARRALGDDSDGTPSVIQTVRGRGYRIGVPVEVVPSPSARPVPNADPPPASHGPSPPSSLASTAAPRRRAGRWAAVVAAAALLASALWLARPYAALPEPDSGPRPRAFPRSTVAVVLAPDAPAAAELDEVLEERLDALAELHVVSRTAVREAVRVHGLDPAPLGRALHAGTLVFPTWDPRDGQGRLTIEVVDSGSGFRHWARSYDREPSAARDALEAAAADLAHVLGLLVGTGTDFVRRTGRVDALAYYLEGRQATHAASRERLLDAVARYEQAIELDPDYVEAWVGLAEACERLWYLDRGGAGWLDRGEISIQHALERAPLDSEALATQATLLRARRRWSEAEECYRRALEHGASAFSYSRYASLLMMLGRTTEAVPLIERSLQLASLDPDVQRVAGRVYYYLGDHTRAIAHLTRVLELDPLDSVTPRLLASALNAAGRREEAKEAFLRIVPPAMRPLARIHGRLFGPEANLRALLKLDIALSDRPCRVDANGTAMAWALLGERDHMLECLAEDVDWHLWYVAEDPVFDPYRADPAFQRLLASAGFPSS